MSQEPLQVPPKLQPGELSEDLEATLFRDEPIVPNEAMVAAVRQRRRFKQRPARRERLLDRRDWQTIVIVAGIVGLVTFICAFLGIVLGAAF